MQWNHRKFSKRLGKMDEADFRDQLAAVLGKTPTLAQVRSWRAGVYSPNAATAVAIAKVLGVDAGDLFT